MTYSLLQHSACISHEHRRFWLVAAFLWAVIFPASCQYQQFQPKGWFLYPVTAPIGDETHFARNAAFDTASGTLVVFEDGSKSIYVYKDLPGLNKTAADLWSLRASYPTSTYGVFATETTAFFCESVDQGSTSCSRVDLNNGISQSDPSAMQRQHGVKGVPSIFYYKSSAKQYILSFSTSNVISYFDSDMKSVDNMNALEGQGRQDGFSAGPTYLYNDYGYVVWLRTTLSSEDREIGNLIKIGRFCAGSDSLKFYVEAAFSSDISTRNVSVTLLNNYMVISSRQSTSLLSFCYLSKQVVENAIQLAVTQCVQGKSLETPGFAAEGINAAVNCVSGSVKSHANKGCAGLALFAAAQSTPCSSPTNIELPGGMSSIVDTAALELSNNNFLLFFTDANGRFVKVAVTVQADSTFSSTLISVQNINASVGALLANEQIIRLFVHEGYAQLVFVTTHRVIRMPASNCTQYSSCESCLTSKDPLCAWCPSTGQCTMKVKQVDSCPDMIDSGNSAQCPRLSADDIDLDRFDRVKFKLSPWPFKSTNPSSFVCKFDGYPDSYESLANDGDNIHCPIPNLDANFSGLSKLSFRLLATFDGRRVEIAWLPELTIFKCSALKTCSLCAGGLGDKCSWCFGDSKCSSVQTQSCSGHIVKMQQRCPVLNGIVDDKGNLVPSLEFALGVQELPREVRFSVASGGEILKQVNSSMQCTFIYNTKGGKVETHGGPFAAKMRDNDIVCETNSLRAPNDTSLLPDTSRELILQAVVLANAQPLEYKGRAGDGSLLGIRFYSCSPSPTAPQTLNTCGHCRALNSTWGCVWCESSRCVPKGSCTSAPASPVGAVCKAIIKAFQPVSGPSQGGTLLTISTLDLDTEMSKLRVTVASLECKIDQERTRLPDTVVCATTNAVNGYHYKRLGKVKLFGENDVVLAESVLDYNFQSMMADGKMKIEPSFGPLQGGTVINITGQNFGIGSTRSVWLGSRPCSNVKAFPPNVLQCITSSFSASGPVSVHVIVDAFNSSSDNPSWPDAPRFDYRPNPEPLILSAFKEWSAVKIAPRGGSLIRVGGAYLNASASPQFAIRVTDTLHGSKSIRSPCHVESSTSMMCRSPPLPPSYNNTSKVDYGLSFSGNSEFWSYEREWLHLVITPNPEFVKATIDVVTGILTISGTSLNDSFTEADYNITVADRQCSIKSLRDVIIICTVPLIPPQAANNATNSFIPIENIAHSQVIIVLGGLQPPIIISGLTSVDGAGPVEDVFRHLVSNSLPIVIPAAVGFVVVLAVIILVACLCTRAKREHMRKYEKTKSGIVSQQQQQLTKFQRKIFADQTQVAPQEVRWNGEIPFHKYRDYCQNFFFPIAEEIRAIQTPPDVANIGVSELERFYRLLLRENFLIAFVNSLENPQHFKHADITRVAALLSVVLQPHMVYHTTIIRRLLDDLILRTAHRNPSELKQLLRRAEHVVERLLANWLAMLLYDHVLSGPGQALFRMTRACHLKTTSGKVDPATGRSLYALSERSLLQDPSEPLEITLNIFDNVRSAIQSEEGRRTVTVLDCDTVAQAKAKILDAIYEGVPFSARLTPADCDIQFVQADGKRVDLPDDSQKTGSGTLPQSGKSNKPTLIKSFNIENNTKVIIIRRPAGTYGTNTTSLKSVVSQHSSNGAAGSDRGSGDSHSLLNGSPLMPGSTRPLVAGNGSANNSASAIFYAGDGHGGIAVSLTGDEQKTPGGTRRIGLLKENRRRAGSERIEKRSSRASNASSAAAAAAIESTAPPSEYFLSLLIITKKSLQEHIDNLFASLFRLQPSTDPSFPLAIRYLFDLFDDLGKKHGITDPEVLYCWKTNAVPLRFWVNLIQNPDYVLDVEVIEPVKHCLAVVTQALMDSCARDPQPLSQRSASNKQLFSEDVVRYRGYVQKFYSDIQHVDFGGPLDFRMNNFLAEQSHVNARAFDPQGSLRRLAESALRYSNDIDRQLRMGFGPNMPVPDGVALADEFASIVRDLRIAGIGSLSATNSGAGGGQLPSSNATPNTSIVNTTGISFTATPVAAALAQSVPPSRHGRAGSQPQMQQQQTQQQLHQQTLPPLPQQMHIPSNAVGSYQVQQSQYIVMKHPTHL